MRHANILLAALAGAALAHPARAGAPPISAGPPPISAGAPPISTYAIVVGDNAGGPGQTPLRYAEDDARRIDRVLVELGGYTPDRVELVLHPTPDALRAALAHVGDRVAQDQAAGRQTRVFFYYSGHARAAAIDLGADELPLDELRQRLFQIPATLTIVVLDACQSGAFSRIKGARPAADFSWSSRQQLDASGVAVLASSTGSELSQESEQLEGSYFTANLIAGLRGAGDANGDGEVSLDEAYRYAYQQTLLQTAATAVGGQHVTFEADLKGHGDVALSFPRAASTAIELPAALDGQVLVEDRGAHAVVAEVAKARGSALRIAVAPGAYEVLVRRGDTLARCDVDGGGAVDLGRCRIESIVPATAKGGGVEAVPMRLELGVFAGPEHHDAYTDNLVTFGYDTPFLDLSGGVELTFLSGLGREPIGRAGQRVWIGAELSHTAMSGREHGVVGSGLQQDFAWSTSALELVGRVEQPLAAADHPICFSLYAQLGAGLGLGQTSLAGADGMTYRDTHLGPAFSAGAGLHVTAPHRRWLGFTLGYRYDDAPVIEDLIGHTHQSGGHRVFAAFSYNFWKL
jgi:hypothetical protein